MSMAWVRAQYGVPAKRGGRILFEGQPAVIVGTKGPHLLIQLDGETEPVPIHPTWEVVYLPDAKASAEPRVWHAGDPEPADDVVVRDCHGDLWAKGPNGLWETYETKPLPWATVAKKWPPLTEDLRPRYRRHRPVVTVELPEGSA